MARTAVVTGGSRGIGAAISKALKQAGYNVAANYGGNDEAAAKFKKETGIPVFNITVNVIAPGYIATEMVLAVPKEVLDKNIIPQIPVRRLGQPEEIARVAVFLASDDAGFITGSTISANGGQYMS
jgi:NAD(P)-dependent dehydrogenase (short-subunit alcohol dehydrogenase family)